MLPKKDGYTNNQLNGKIAVSINGLGEAHIPIAKLTQYALNPEKSPDKAKAFEEALGYNLGNAQKLIENILDNVNKYMIVKRPTTIHGEPFQIAMDLKGENSKTANVITGWIIDSKTCEIRLTSIYVNKRKKG